MFQRFSLRAKLTSVFLVLSAFLAIVGGLGFFTLKFMNSSYHEVAAEMLPKAFAMAEMRAVVQTMSRYMAHMADPQTPPETHTKLRKLITDRFERFEKAIAKFETFPLTAGEKEVIADYHERWKTLKSILEEGIKLDEAGGPENVAKLQKITAVDLFNIMEKMNESSAKSRKVFDNESEASLAATSKAADKGYFINICAVLIGIVVSLVLSAILGSRISDHLRSVAHSFSANVDEVNVQATQMAASAEELSSAVSQQSATLQATSSSIQEISEMVRMNAENANKSTNLATSSEATARESQRSVEDMLKAIEAINDSNNRGFERVNESNHQFAKIVKVITEIGDKTKVINDIVFQTKLLSFNASVEAARAGEHGKGFAVVAEEVGNLAAMSGTASREISEMLGTGIATVNEIVAATRSQLDELMRDSKSSVERGVSIAGRCRDSLEQLVGNVSELQRMVHQISGASTEQAQAISDVTRSIRELDGVTELNRNLAGQSSTSSLILKERSNSLEESLRILQETISGASGGFTSVTPLHRPHAAGAKPKTPNKRVA